MHRLLPAAAAGALALGLAACEPDLAPPFEPEGTGSVAGRLYFDANDDFMFNPVAGDTALVGVPVELRVRGTENVLATTTTAADGAFGFADVPVGTHDVYVVATPATLGEVVLCQNPLAASVYRAEEVYVTPIGKLACIVDVAEAKEADPGEIVLVRGTVTAAPGDLRNNNLYVQDETGGIQAFGVTVPVGAIVQGDVIEVQGGRDAFRTEVQIGFGPTVRKVADGTPVAPEVVTAGHLGGISDPFHEDVGRLVVVRGATVTGFDSATDQNGLITDATGSAILRLDANPITTIGTAAFQAGQCYDVTGVVGIFDNATQLKPRTAADVVQVPCP